MANLSTVPPWPARRVAGFMVSVAFLGGPPVITGKGAFLFPGGLQCV